MRLCFTKSFVLTLATLVVLLVPLSVQAAYYGYSAPSPSYGNYGNYNAANDMTCGYSNTRFGASSHGGSCASCFRFGPPPRSIKYIMLGLNARIPTGWAMGQEVIGSNNGGMAVSLSATGFQQSLVNEVSAILFKDPLSDQVLYQHQLSHEDLWLTGSHQRKLQFVTPPLSAVIGTTFYSRKVNIYEFKLAFQLWDYSVVDCANPAGCRLKYSFAYTPYIDYLSNTVAVANQDLEFRIVRTRGLEVVASSLAIKDIKVRQDWVQQNCDFKTYSTITASTSTSVWGHRQYSCNYNGLHFFSDGELEYQDYVGRATILDSAITKDFSGHSYQVRILPAITYISQASGFRGSGLALVIKGTSLAPFRTRFFIAGQECHIMSQPEYCPCGKLYTATCMVPEVPEVMPQNFYVGNHGW